MPALGGHCCFVQDSVLTTHPIQAGQLDANRVHSAGSPVRVLELEPC